MGETLRSHVGHANRVLTRFRYTGPHDLLRTRQGPSRPSLEGRRQDRADHERRDGTACHRSPTPPRLTRSHRRRRNRVGPAAHRCRHRNSASLCSSPTAVTNDAEPTWTPKWTNASVVMFVAVAAQLLHDFCRPEIAQQHRDRAIEGLFLQRVDELRSWVLEGGQGKPPETADVDGLDSLLTGLVAMFLRRSGIDLPPPPPPN